MSKIKKLNFKIAKSDSVPIGHVTVEWVGTMVMGMGEEWGGGGKGGVCLNGYTP